tara:strand:- start:4445 stop:5113 length:669 start_codon:yes stop_codon:yes gene_type:complete
MEKGVPSGLCPAFLRAIEEMEPTIKFVGMEKFIPTKRIHSSLKDGTLDAFACFAPTEERKKYIDFIEPPLFVNDVQAAVLKDSPAARVTSWDQMKTQNQWIFLATLGTPHVNFLENIPGIKIDAQSGDNINNLEKLKASRGDVFIHFGYILKGIVQKEQITDKIVILPFNIRKEKQYLALSKKVSAETKKKLENAIYRLDKKGELKKIFDKYTSNYLTEKKP